MQYKIIIIYNLE